MNNYYFTADKWYGPLPEGILPQYVTPSLFSLIESLPSGDSLIPQFAGMVKEEGKDFVIENGTAIPYDKRSKPSGCYAEYTTGDRNDCVFPACHCIAENPLPKLQKSLAYATEHISPGKKFIEFAETATEAERWLHNELANAFVAGWEAKTEYLKTKQ